jgi:murein L,D-transpeptidase YcbB/YkuD
VPPSIVHNEYLPALAQDPTVLDRMGLRVSYSGGGVSIWQPPGPGINFPNRFLVYQHDTPDKYYFTHEVRAYSHGCMRVQVFLDARKAIRCCQVRGTGVYYTDGC